VPRAFTTTPNPFNMTMSCSQEGGRGEEGRGRREVGGEEEERKERGGKVGREGGR